MEVCFKSIDEFVEWSWKEKRHKEELQQHNTELEIENRELKATLQQKREEISRLTIEQNGGPVELPEDDLPDFEK